MAHALHQLPQVRARVCRQRVTGMPKIMEVDAHQADLADRGQPRATVEVGGSREPAQAVGALGDQVNLGVAADLQIEAFPCGPAWKWVIPALQPV
jgi:hypothetical protein